MHTYGRDTQSSPYSVTVNFSNFSNLLPEILAVLPTGCRDESTLYTHNMQSLYK